MSCFRSFATLLVFLFLLNLQVGGALGTGNQRLKDAQTEGQPWVGGTFRIPLLNEPPTLDPAMVEDIYSISVVQQMFDGLVQFSPELYVIPALAESWQMEDNGRTFRFFLRPNVRFHNGRPVEPEDVVFSLSRLIQVDPAPSILPHLLKIRGAQDFREQKSDRVAGMHAEGAHSVVVILDEPYTPFLAALGMYQAKIVPREEVALKGSAFGRNPVGSGPFRLKSWDEERCIKLQRYADYHGGAPYLQEVHFMIYAGGRIDDVLVDFRNGKLESMPVYWQFRDTLMENRNLQWVHRPSLSLLFYGMNVQHAALKNPGLRKALAAATDRRKILGEVYKGQFEPVTTLVPPGMPGYQPQNQEWHYDLDLAKRLAKEALGTDTDQAPTIEVVSNSHSPLAQAELNVVRDSWAQLGIRMLPKFIPDWSQFEEYLKSDALQVYRYSWVADMPDPESFLQPLFGSSSRVNYMRYASEEVDGLLKEISRSADPLERARLCQRVEQAVAASTPLVPLFYLSVDRVYQPYVQGIETSALGEEAVSFHRLWLKVSFKP